MCTKANICLCHMHGLCMKLQKACGPQRKWWRNRSVSHKILWPEEDFRVRVRGSYSIWVTECDLSIEFCVTPAKWGMSCISLPRGGTSLTINSQTLAWQDTCPAPEWLLSLKSKCTHLTLKLRLEKHLTGSAFKSFSKDRRGGHLHRLWKRC